MKIALLACALIAPSPAAQPPILTLPGHASKLAIEELRGPSLRLQVNSPSFSDGGDIPLEDTQYGTNRFPGLSWSAGPRSTRSYVVIMQGALANATSIHLVVANLPASVNSLPAGLAGLPPRSFYGPNVHGPAQPMRGIFDEYRLFTAYAPNAKILPVVSTGGAAEKLGRKFTLTLNSPRSWTMLRCFISG